MNSRSQNHSPMFSSRIFVVSGFTFMFVIYFELTFIRGFEFIFSLHSFHHNISLRLFYHLLPLLLGSLSFSDNATSKSMVILVKLSGAQEVF